MAEIIRLRNNPHDEVQELLPWFVNHTLDVADVERIQTHLSECAECRSELEAERQLAAAITGNEPTDSRPSWERLEKRLIANQTSKFQRVPLWLRHVPLGWAIASPVAVAAAMALVFVSLPAKPAGEPQYRALGTLDIAQPANLVVQFQSSSKVSDVERALQLANARLVDGPTQTGAYLLRVDPAKRQLALKQLRDNQAISLAQPIDAPPGE